jgi:BirA family biotin operon repressor/biotin-[acetyl-CoA-carboxylase] ligase
LASDNHYAKRGAEPLSTLGAFDLDAVHRALEPTAFRRIHYTLETGSTNDDAGAVLGTPGSGGLVFLTEFQRAGRGRRGRDWVAPAGSSLLFTAVLPDRIAADAIWAVTFWTALCVADGIETATGLRVRLQWPNDLLLDGRKCCGILCASRVTGVDAAVACGVGLNVRRPAAALDVQPPPSFLSDLAKAVGREEVLVAILRAFQARLPLLGTPDTVARLWEVRAGLAGTPYAIAIDGDEEPIEAVADSIAGDGSLIAEVGSERRRFSLADARVLR